MDEKMEKKVDESWKEKAKTEPEHPESGHEAHKEMPEPNFKFFLTTLAMQAWIALGAIPNPLTDKTEDNLDQAKFIIDTLGILEIKTKGNLDKEEVEMLEHLLYELRLAYVDKKNKK